jgi:hypothetical protein
MNDLFEVAAGSVVGRDHLGRGNLLVGRNNQDAYAWSCTAEGLVAVVCDGCGSGGHSEVGANLGARLLVRALGSCPALFAGAVGSGAASSAPPLFVERARHRVLAWLRELASGMGDNLAQTVADYFLFTVVGALLLRDWTYIISIGDGVFAVNGEVTRLGPAPHNAPPYLAYPLCGAAPEAFPFQVQRSLPTAAVDSVLLGTDGVAHLIEAAGRPLPGRREPVGPLGQFWEEDRYFRNPDALRRRLALVNSEHVRLDREAGVLVREPGLLPDDTTVLVIRRRPLERDRPWTST